MVRVGGLAASGCRELAATGVAETLGFWVAGA